MLAGILLTIVALLVVGVLLFPRAAAVYMIFGGAFAFFLWLNAYRVSRKKRATGASVNPSI